MKSRTKKIFLGLSIAIPFLLYSGYYYGEMIQNAPYKFNEFSKIQLHFGSKNQMQNRFDSQLGEYQYINRKDSLVTKQVKMSKETLQSIHRKASELGIWNIPIDLTTNNPNGTRYFIVLEYHRKTKTITFDTDWNATPKIAETIRMFVEFVEEKIHDTQQ